jgi:hypothetical protein
MATPRMIRRSLFCSSAARPHLLHLPGLEGRPVPEE